MRNMWNDFNRRAIAVVTVLVLVFAVSLVLADRSSKATSDPLFVLASGEEPEELETIPENTTVPVTVVEPPVSASTTLTTVATTTTRAATTTSQAITTTTQAPTTTLPPTTTTTTTLPAGTRTVNGTSSFSRTPTPALLGGNANYYRSLPFYPETGWTDGERAGYSCLYGFLMLNGQPVGRVTFARVDGAGYAFINDNSMKEGVRHYDGTLGTPDNPSASPNVRNPISRMSFRRVHGSCRPSPMRRRVATCWKSATTSRSSSEPVSLFARPNPPPAGSAWSRMRTATRLSWSITSRWLAVW